MGHNDSMRMGHVELFVGDPVRSARFYVDVLGFELEADQGEFQWVRLGDREILLRPGRNVSADRLDQASHDLVLYSDDLARTRTELEGRGLEFSPHHDGGCLTFQDPDGHWWQLVNPEG